MPEVALPPSDGFSNGPSDMLSATAFRQPTLQVLANGTLLAAPLAAEIVSNNYHAADRFHLTAALPTPPDAAFWASATGITLDIRVSLGASAPVNLIEGPVDTVELDAISGVLRLEGRDNSAALIQARTQETFANRSASEIATVLAGRHALTADVTATTTPVGRYWQLEHDSITLDQFSRVTTEWDLLIALAAHEGFDVWVSGRTLHFHPAASLAVNPVPSATLQAVATQAGPANVTALRLERALNLAGGVQVTVKSWHSRMNTAVTQSVGGGTATTATTGAPPRNYVYVVPNLTADVALKLARTRLVELTSHERVVVADMPGELVLTPRMAVGIAGTGTAFDQLYWIDEIERSIDWRRGFTQRVRARNASTTIASGT